MTVGVLSWLRRRRLDEEDLQEEIRAHLAIASEEKTADGADPQEAHYAALREFGNVTLTTEATRSVWTPRWLETARDLMSDVHYGVRALAKNPGFSLTVVAVLTLGIGLNAAVFAMLKGLALTPLGGVDGAVRLRVLFGETSTGRVVRVSYPDYQYMRDHDRAFAGLMGTGHFVVNLGRGRRARQVSAELVTANYFQVLGVGAQQGRTLLPSDEIAPGAHPVVVISDGVWRRDFSADPAIIGKAIDVNNVPLTVVGVTDPAFHGTVVSYDVEVFIPVMMAAQIGLGGGSPDVLSNRLVGLIFPHGYPRPGTTPGAAVAQVEAAWATLSGERPVTAAAQRMRVAPFWRSPTGGQVYVVPTLGVLSAMGLLVLLIACANVAGLVLVRGVSRRGEIAVRLALGATRTRIMRLLFVESLVLAVPAAIFGVLLAQRGIPVLVRYAEWLAAPQRLFFNMQVDGLLIAFAALVACGSAVASGLVPALRSSRVDLVSVINQDAAPRGAPRGRLRASLVVAQVAVSVLLVVGAGLVSRSFEAARRANPGFDPTHVASLEIDLTHNAYGESRGLAFYRKLLESARADAAIESATLAAYAPLKFTDTRAQRIAIEGYVPAPGEDMAFMFNTVGPDYFRTLRIGVRAGRPFDDRDDELGAPVVVVNNTLAERFWGGAAHALGKRMRIGHREWRTVVGVAADLKYARINEPPRPYFYVPVLQAYRPNMILHTRGTGSPELLVDRSRALVAALDGELPILYARPMTEQVAGALIFFRLTATMLFLFGTAGMALAAMGTYGLVSYTVKQRAHEIGLRMALGAPRFAVVRHFIARGLRLGATGAALGTFAAFGITRLLGGVLFGVSATDATSFGRALSIVLGGVVLATLVPAWRAARMNPVSALRHQ